MKIIKNIDKIIFFLSIAGLLFFFLVYFSNSLYLTKRLLLILFCFIILETFVLKKNFIYINYIKFFILIAIIGNVAGAQNTLALKDYIKNSHDKLKIFINTSILKTNYDLFNNLVSKNNIETLEKIKSLDNRSYYQMSKRRDEEISLLNFEHQKDKKFSFYSNKLKDAVPFYIFKNLDLLISSAWWGDGHNLMRVNQEFDVVWKKKLNVHHFADLDNDKKTLYIPSFDIYYWDDFIKTQYYEKLKDYNCSKNSSKFIDSVHYNYKKQIKNWQSPKDYKSHNTPLRVDTLLKINIENGNVYEKIDLLALILNDDHLFNILIRSNHARCRDLLHTNDVRYLNKKIFLENFSLDPGLKKQDIGDELLLVSLRDISSLVVIDLNSKKIVWSVSNLMRNQHSPRITSKGTILIFDNYAFEEVGNKFGMSAVKEIDPYSKKIIGIFHGNEEFYFSSRRRGRLQVVGKKVYVTSSDQNLFFKIECNPVEKKYLNECSFSKLFQYNQGTLEEYPETRSIFINDIYFKDENGLYEILE